MGFSVTCYIDNIHRLKFYIKYMAQAQAHKNFAQYTIITYV